MFKITICLLILFISGCSNIAYNNDLNSKSKMKVFASNGGYIINEDEAYNIKNKFIIIDSRVKSFTEKQHFIDEKGRSVTVVMKIIAQIKNDDNTVNKIANEEILYIEKYPNNKFTLDDAWHIYEANIVSETTTNYFKKIENQNNYLNFEKIFKEKINTINNPIIVNSVSIKKIKIN